MKNFTYFRPTTAEQAVALLENRWGNTELLAGGTDLHDLQKEYIAQPTRVVSLTGIGALAGIRVDEVPKLQEGRPNLIDHMKNHQIALVINTPSGRGARTDEGKIRAAAVANGVTCITTLAAAHAAVEACRALRQREWTVSALQDRFPAG